MPRIAVLQMTSGIDPEANYQAIYSAMAEASANGAAMVFTPEMSLLLDRNRQRASTHVTDQERSPYTGRLIRAAQEFQIAVTAGLPVKLPEGRLANRTWYFSPDGSPPIIYDKIHMFDVTLADSETWQESAAYEAGSSVVSIADTPAGRVGLTTCYDVRFPALFNALGQARCDVITVPAAFTKPTGAAHWHVLLRARAIEASAYVVAPAQVGTHEDGRSTYGHSLVIDPWGTVVLDMGGEKASLGYADIDARRIAEVRAQIPSLANRRPITA